ncbi:MAG TPA: hypothetical protein VFA75_01895 [Nevskia sp.]|nr:hypothetical protein [Nevskia sp.]
MRRESLFGELATRLSSHPENVATEALLYLLQHHAGTWPALRAFLGAIGIPAPLQASFRTQFPSKDDTSIPDLAVADQSGAQVLLMEAKFWAGLTPNQPTTYLKRLPVGQAGTVLVIAPAQRFVTLWHKLAEKCAADGLTLDAPVDPAPGFRKATLSGTQHLLALTSWRTALVVLAQDAEGRADADALGDIQQLSGLCERMDSTAFLPLRAEELSRQVGQRIEQLSALFEDVVVELVKNHGAMSQSTGGGGSTRGRFFKLGHLGCFLALSPGLWARHGESPLWLSVQYIDPEGHWTTAPWIHDRLVLISGNTPAVVSHDDSWRPCVSVDLPTGAEKSELVPVVGARIAAMLGTIGQPPDPGPA